MSPRKLLLWRNCREREEMLLQTKPRWQFGNTLYKLDRIYWMSQNEPKICYLFFRELLTLSIWTQFLNVFIWLYYHVSWNLPSSFFVISKSCFYYIFAWKLDFGRAPVPCIIFIIIKFDEVKYDEWIHCHTKFTTKWI